MDLAVVYTSCTELRHFAGSEAFTGTWGVPARRMVVSIFKAVFFPVGANVIFRHGFNRFSLIGAKPSHSQSRLPHSFLKRGSVGYAVCELRTPCDLGDLLFNQAERFAAIGLGIFLFDILSRYDLFEVLSMNPAELVGLGVL